MFGIRNNIVVSIMVHTLLFAAAFIAGSSSEFRSMRMITVSLAEEWGSGMVGQREQLPAQQLSQKTLGKEVASRNSAGQESPPVMPRARDQAVPSTLSAITQSFPSDNKDIGTADSALHLPGNPAARRTGSLAGSDTDVVSQHNPAGGTHSTPVAAGGGQQYGAAGDASMRQKIRAALQANLVYPYMARKKQMEGSVTVSFRINQTGNPESIRILKGSGYSILDAAARETVVKASPFPTKNNAVEVPITFTLKDH